MADLDPVARLEACELLLHSLRDNEELDDPFYVTLDTIAGEPRERIREVLIHVVSYFQTIALGNLGNLGPVRPVAIMQEAVVNAQRLAGMIP